MSSSKHGYKTDKKFTTLKKGVDRGLDTSVQHEDFTVKNYMTVKYNRCIHTCANTVSHNKCCMQLH